MGSYWNWKSALSGKTDFTYRQAYLREDINLTRGVFGVVSFWSLLYVYIDYGALYPSALYYGLLALRIAFFFVSIALIFSLPKEQDINKIDYIILIWGMSYLFLTYLSTIGRGKISVDNMNINHVWILGFYMLLPNRQLFRTIPALFLSLISIYILLNAESLGNRTFTTLELFTNITTIIVINLIGFFVSLRFDAQRYHQYLIQKTLRSGHEQLVTLAKTDSLTGILNRRGFFELAELEFDRYKRYQTDFSFAILDMDKLKFINDHYGHPAGDLALQTLIEVINEGKRSSDIFGRLAGDEFGLILPGTSADVAQNLMTRIQKRLSSKEVTLNPGSTTYISFSVGITQVGQEDQSFDDIYRRADDALLDAKREKRDYTGKP